MSDDTTERRKALCEAAQLYARQNLEPHQTLVAQGANEATGDVFTLYRCGCPDCNGQVYLSVMDIPNRQECVTRVTKELKEALAMLDN